MTPSRMAPKRRQRADGAGRAEQVADHRLRRADRHLVGVVAEGGLDRARLGHVVERRRRAVGDDLVDLVGATPACRSARVIARGGAAARSARAR